MREREAEERGAAAGGDGVGVGRRAAGPRRRHAAQEGPAERDGDAERRGVERAEERRPRARGRLPSRSTPPRFVLCYTIEHSL